MCDCENSVMPWTWVRPQDPSVLAGRPLLDLGAGDGQTRAALVEGSGLVVGVDHAPDLLRPGDVNAEATRLPFRDASFATILAADLFHHLDDAQLASVLSEIRRVLRMRGRLVAWWYADATRPAPDAPRFPRRLDEVLTMVVSSGFAQHGPLRLATMLESTAATVGLLAER